MKRSAGMLEVAGPIVVVATMRARPGYDSAALEHRRRQVELTHAPDAGCSTYGLREHVREPDRLMIIQRESMRAAEHTASEHSQRALGELPDLLVKLSAISYLHSVPSGDMTRGAL
jgi:quinol monooxygenase YgiN